MVDAELRTRDGGYVTTVRLPRFVVLSEVVIWGQRVFVLRSKDPLVYTEAYSYVVPPPVFATGGNAEGGVSGESGR